MEHIWNGTVLTVISDSGASSADLKGDRGATGPRGPQGPAGVILNEQGQVVVDLAPYYTGAEVDDKIAAALENADLDNYPTNTEMADFVSSTLGSYATKEELANVKPDLTGYATETYVDAMVSSVEQPDLTNYATKNYVATEVAKAQLEGAGVDTSVFATKDDLAAYEVKIDGNTLILNSEGAISTAIGGGVGGYFFHLKETLLPSQSMIVDIVFEAEQNYCFEFKYSDGVVDTIVGHLPYQTNEYGLWSVIIESRNTTYLTPEKPLVGCLNATGEYYDSMVFGFKGGNYPEGVTIEELCISIGNKPTGSYTPIDANFIPVDGVTTQIVDGKLVATVGGEVNLTNYYTKAEVDAKITYGTTDLTAGSSYLASGTLYVVYE